MGQRIAIDEFSTPAIEPIRAPCIHFTSVDKVRTADGIITMVLIEDQLRADGGIDRVVVARLTTEVVLSRNNFAKVMMALESAPEARRARMD